MLERLRVNGAITIRLLIAMPPSFTGLNKSLIHISLLLITDSLLQILALRLLMFWQIKDQNLRIIFSF